ncbi:helix-turn-helix transcriptional regulator [Halomonas sp. E14]|uniref:helix-turn-helix transcriptional regulator n=1 Tax=Halomonas sp. E14 TaxID=3397245 RepID=UPI00403EE965
MTTLDLDTYDKLVSSLYEAAHETEHWRTALDIVKELFAANFVTLILRVPSQDETGLMVAVGRVQGRELGDASVSYFPYQHQTTPFSNLSANKVFTVEDVMSEGEWRQSSYRKHWCAPSGVYHLLGADIETPDAGRLRFRITRDESSPGFGTEERALCERIIPHLRRALALHNQLDRTASMSALYCQAVEKLSLGMILVDESGLVIDQNLAARHLIEIEDGLKVVGGRLEAFYPSDNKELRRLIRQAFSQAETETGGVGFPEAMSLTRPSGEVNLGVVVEPIARTAWADGKGQPAAAVYIRDAVGRSQASSEVAKKLFGLTPAETQLSLQLANGLSLEEAAEELGIRRNTARAHLRSIFSKTGVRRQTELVRLFLNSVAPLGGGLGSELDSLAS